MCRFHFSKRKTHILFTDKPVRRLLVSSSHEGWVLIAGIQIGCFQSAGLHVRPPPLPSVILAANCTPAWHPPSSPNTPPPKFICHLVITELVNVSPPALFLSSQLVYCYILLLSAVLLSHLPSPPHLLHDHLSALCCELMITVTKSTYKLPLWFRHQRYSSCLLLRFIEPCHCAAAVSLLLISILVYESHDDPTVTLSRALIGGSVT